MNFAGISHNEARARARPADKLAWRPHPKSMTLGQLAIHVASIPGAICGLAALDEFDASKVDFTPPQPATYDDVLAALDNSLRNAEAYLSGLSRRRR